MLTPAVTVSALEMAALRDERVLAAVARGQGRGRQHGPGVPQEVGRPTAS
jgi:hypothetical protein